MSTLRDGVIPPCVESRLSRRTSDQDGTAIHGNRQKQSNRYARVQNPGFALLTDLSIKEAKPTL